MTPRKKALVTGGGTGIGRSAVLALARAGYDIAINYSSSAAAANAVAGEAEALGARTLLLQCDVSNDDAVRAMMRTLDQEFGRLDALVNNASAFYPTPIGRTTPAQWDELFASNARAPFFLAQAAAPHLKAARGGIVNLVDIHAGQPLAGHAVYGMAKASLRMLTRALARDLAPEVRVNAIAPGAILWPEHPGAEDGADEAARSAILALVPMGRLGEPDEVARVAVFLAGDDASYMTGQTVYPDGGRLALNYTVPVED